jgi:hypothetical protein
VNIEDKTEAYNSEELFLLFIILEGNLSTVLFCEKHLKKCLTQFIMSYSDL